MKRKRKGQERKRIGRAGADYAIVQWRFFPIARQIKRPPQSARPKRAN